MVYRYKDFASYGFENPACLGPENQDVGSVYVVFAAPISKSRLPTSVFELASKKREVKCTYRISHGSRM